LQELADAEAELSSTMADETLRHANAKDKELNLESSLADAVGQYELAVIEANSQRALADSNASTQRDLQSAINREDQARRRVEIAEGLLERFPLTLEAENRQNQTKI